MRHELATPIATMRMTLLVLERQLMQRDIDQPACQERMELLDKQLGALIAVLHSLRDWDLGAGEAAIARAALAAQCVALMRPAFEVNGTHLQIDEAICAQDGDSRLPCSARRATCAWVPWATCKTTCRSSGRSASRRMARTACVSSRSNTRPTLPAWTTFPARAPG